MTDKQKGSLLSKTGWQACPCECGRWFHKDKPRHGLDHLDYAFFKEMRDQVGEVLIRLSSFLEAA